jgi:hypothetical protein
VKKKYKTRYWFAWYPVRDNDTGKRLWWKRVVTRYTPGRGHEYWDRVLD